MRFKMIGYGKFHYRAKSGRGGRWPAVGVALQKSYISIYFSIAKDGAPLVQSYAGRLNDMGGTKLFSFVRFDDLNLAAVSALVAEADRISANRPIVPSKGKRKMPMCGRPSCQSYTEPDFSGRAPHNPHRQCVRNSRWHL